MYTCSSVLETALHFVPVLYLQYYMYIVCHCAST